MNNNKSPHILNTASNLLGFCFIIITSLKISNKSNQTIVDEMLAFTSLFFLVSSILSFLSMQSKTADKSNRFELIADWFFLSGLISLLVEIVIIVFNLF